MVVQLPVSKNGIPLLGFGSGTKYYKGPGRETELDTALVDTTLEAISQGLTHLDWAEVYGNDKELGAIIAKSSVPRSELFITEKYFAGDGSYSIHSASANPYERLKKFIADTGSEYADLYLLHAPFIAEETHGFDLRGAWKYMQQCQREGLAKRIGVSNFAVEDLEVLFATEFEKPQVNQIEFSAMLQNQTPGIFDWCRQHDVVVEAYSPLGPLYKADFSQESCAAFKKLVEDIAAKHAKTPGQVLLRWTIQYGAVPVSTTTNPKRLAELIGVFGWELQQGEVDAISAAGAACPTLRQYWNNEYAKFN